SALIPTLGSALVIASNEPKSKLSLTRLLSTKAPQFIGDISYSIYLWHWPAIIFLPMFISQELGTVHKLLIILFSLVASYLTKILVEDPLRRSTGILKGQLRPVLFTTIGGFLLCIVAFLSVYILDQRVAHIQNELETQLNQNQVAGGDFVRSCFGP